MEKPDILKAELEDTVTETKQEKFKSQLEITETDAEQVAGGAFKVKCAIYED